MSNSTAWFNGSKENYPAQIVEIDGSDETLAQGNYYLRHTNAELSLEDKFQGMMSNAGVASPQCFVTKSGRIRISSSATFSVDWLAATTLRDDLGFTQGNLSGASFYVADEMPRLLWSPGYRATTKSPLRTDGWDVDDTIITQSASGQTIVATTHYTRVEQRFSWAIVPIARVWTPSELGGEFKVFRDQVLKNVYRFFHYDLITEDRANTTDEVDWGSAEAHGPYKSNRPTIDWFSRQAPTNQDAYSSIEIECTKTAEYSS